MKRSVFGALALAIVVGLMGAGSQGQTAPSAEAVAAMKARLAELKKEAAELEAKIAAAEAPAAGTQIPIVAALNAMPKNLWPGDSDTDIKQSLRDKWLTENIKPGATGTYTGTVIVFNASMLYPEGKPSYEGVRVMLDCGKHMVWGKEMEVKVEAVLENVTPPDTLEWGENKKLTLTGTSKQTRTSPGVEVQMETAKMK